MKTASLLLGLSLTFIFVTVLGTASPMLASASIVERGRNHSVLEAGAGRVTVLGNGLNRRDEFGNWIKAEPELTVYQNAIVGTGAGHRVILGHDLVAADAVDYETAAGERIVMSPLAVRLYDPDSGRSTVLGVITNSAAEVIEVEGRHQAVWRNAFSGLQASVVVKYKSGGISQDVVIEEKISLPSGFGLLTRIEVITEIQQLPTPQQTIHVWRQETDPVKRARMASPDLYDESIQLGSALMTLGWAFESDMPPHKGAPVAKRLEELEDGRLVLIESTEWTDERVQSAMERLPQRSARLDNIQVNPGGEFHLPERLIAAAGVERNQRATGEFSRTTFKQRFDEITAKPAEPLLARNNSSLRGLVIDYEMVEDSYSGWDFESGETYLVDEDIFIQGDSSNPIYFHSGAVIKFEPGTTLTISGTVYPGDGGVVFTAVDDDTAGATITNSTGIPTGRYAEIALNGYYLSSDLSLSGMDFRHAETGLYIYGQQYYGHSFSSALFYECDLGVYASSCSISLTGPDFCEVDTWTGYSYGSSVSVSSATECEADRDDDGLEDGWEVSHFGNLLQVGTSAQGANYDYDGDGIDNATELANGTDPNTIAFSPRMGNQQFNTTNCTGSFAVSGGVPAKWAMLIDSTNFTAATWTSYSGSNFTFNIGPTDGEYQVFLGLKGMAVDSQPTWFGTSVILDRVAPTLTLTSPTSTNVFKPFMQIEGYINERLGSVNYDLTNALGLQTNLAGFSRRLTSATNGMVTNWFQCYDVELTNGLNTVTLRVSDPAGNVATDTTTYLVDYLTETNPPVISVTWPSDGSYIGASDFTFRAKLDDETASVVLEIIGGGETNTLTGLVERNGTVWVEDVPMAAGTNFVTLTATDVAHNSSTTNLTLVKSTVTVTMDEVPEYQLNQPTLTVTGTISSSAYKVWINSKEASLDNGDWTAEDVPVTSGGTAVFTVSAIPLTDNNGDGSPASGDPDDPSTQNPQSDEALLENGEWDKPAETKLVHGQWEEHSYSIGAVGYQKKDASWRWDEESGGYAEQYTEDTTGYASDTGARYWLSPDGTEVFEAWTDSPANIVSTDPEDLESWFGQNFDVKGPWADGSLRSTFSYEGFDYDYRQSARNVKVEYRPGGKTRPGEKDIYEVYGSAYEMKPQEFYSEPFGGGPLIPAEQITVVDFGRNLGAESYTYTARPAGEPANVSLEAPRPRIDFITSASDKKFKSECVAPTPIPRERTTIGVCEQVTLWFDPEPSTDPTWTVFPGGIVNPTTASGTLFTAPDQGETHVTVTATFPNGDRITRLFNVLEPKSVKFIKLGERHIQGHCHAGFHAQVIIQPTHVSFYNTDVGEGSCVAEATGCFSVYDGEIHPAWWLKPDYNNYLDTLVDYVQTGIPTPAGPGTFVWPTPWRYRQHGASGDGYTFCVLPHTATATSTACTVTKNEMSATFDNNAPSVNW